MPYYTTEILSANQEMTPEGFLLAKGVRIARTATQIYLADELRGSDGRPLVRPAPGSVYVRIEREPEHVFRPETIASFEGKAFTINHPDVDVTPANWQRLAHGVVKDVRRGAGADADCLVADLLVTSESAIEKVRDEGVREVSCGYSADYQEIQPGLGRQFNIIGNHLALVDQGRCGSRCAIGDSLPMKKKTFIDKIRQAFTTNDSAALEEALKDTPTQDEAEESEEEKRKRPRTPSTPF